MRAGLQCGRAWGAIWGVCFGAVVAATWPSAASALENTQSFKPAIWIDPDGCEHWVMDDGWEGYMTPNVRSDGRPVCHQAYACGAVRTTDLFSNEGARLSRSSQNTIAQFLAQREAKSLILVGHTDRVLPDGGDVELTRRQAEAIAEVARNAGIRVSDVRGYGGRKPRTANSTEEGRIMNKRVEILCLR